MGACRVPNYITGHRGKRWVRSLLNAQEKGAFIIVEETGVRVRYEPREAGRRSFRPWVDSYNRRHDSRDCIPVF